MRATPVPPWQKYGKGSDSVSRSRALWCLRVTIPGAVNPAANRLSVSRKPGPNYAGSHPPHLARERTKAVFALGFDSH